MADKRPSWKAYEPIVMEYIPRLKHGDDELEQRCRLKERADWAQNKRCEVGWQADHCMVLIAALASAHALSIRARPEQIKMLWESVQQLTLVAGQLQASELG